MATNHMRTTQRPRSDSIQSHASFWEKTQEGNRQTKQNAPFATDNDEDFIDQYPSIDDYEPIDSETDSPTTPPSVISTNKAQVWEDATVQDHLIIIFNADSKFDKLYRIIKDDLAVQGFKWTKDDEEEIRPWHFGLTAIRLQFRTPRTVDIPLYMFATRVPNWIKLKSEKEKRKRRDNIQEKPTFLKFLSPLTVSLRYGGFAELNEFVYSRKHSWNNKDSTWSLKLGDQRNGIGFIEWAIEESQVKLNKKLLTADVNECVILDPDESGFNIYIWQKCNMSEFEATRGGPKDLNRSDSMPQSQDWHGNTAKDSNQRKSLPQPNGKLRPPPSLTPRNNPNQSARPANFGRYSRVGNHPPGCYFSIIQFGVHIDSDRVERNNIQNTQTQIKQTLITLIEFFRKHNISICYGKINADEGPKPFLYFLQILPNFPTLITKYSWQMLSVNGYRLQIRLNQQFIDHLYGLCESGMQSDILVYRICVYLSRIFSLKPFVNINQELHHAIDESRRKQKNVVYGIERQLDSTDVNETYVPAITITPTTIRVKPLKLCKTNRVLRAKKQFGTAVEHFALVDIRDENGRPLPAFHFGHLHQHFIQYLSRGVEPKGPKPPTGFSLMGDDRQYHYLHHSQSQVRERQFWFYHHDPNGSNYSHERAYEWMGDFSGEPNPAKRAARIGQCFSTTTVTVEVPAENVGKELDITTPDGKLKFTDGCGRMSIALRNRIKESLKRKINFSAVQFRYAGVKGVVSVYDDMPEGIDLAIRDSMNKFKSTHESFEMCKLSAPRPAFLNRQAIMLLSYRKILDTSLLILQQKNHLALISALLRNNDAEKLILQKIPNWFLPRNIHCAEIDYIHEPFFRQLLISASLQSVRELLQKTRIRVPPNECRNMIGIVDEYNVLKPDEVYIQYTILDENAWDDLNFEDNKQTERKKRKTKILDNRQVVITKNPCHHPGDIRTFTAVDHPKLRDLKDVIVFSQQGDRPAPHDISGSDLDGDEYLVIWHEDLVPTTTPNASPYDHDANIPQMKYPSEITRGVINKTVLEIAEQNCVGVLTNLHLAFADKFGIDDGQKKESRRGSGRDIKSTMELAGAISQEVDSPKTGYHPIKQDEIRKFNDFLGNERPDYCDKSDFQSRESSHILGQLYRSSKKTLLGWNRLVKYHRHLRHLRVRTADDPDDEEDQLDNDEGTKIDLDPTITDGLEIDERLYNDCIVSAGELVFVYRQEMLEILSLYGLSHESDLWCRNSSAGTNGELEDTAISELEHLVKRTKTLFHLKSVIYCEDGKCDDDTVMSELCKQCRDRQQSIAIECYKLCYDNSNSTEQAPILSLPWIFATPLLQNRQQHSIPPSIGLLTTAMKNNLNQFIAKRKGLLYNGQSLQFKKQDSSVCKATVDIPVYAFIEVLGRWFASGKYSRWPFILSRFVRNTSSFQRLDNQRMNTDEWILISTAPSTADYKQYRDELFTIDQPATDSLMHTYFIEILNICFDEGRNRDDKEYLHVSEQIILLLQKLAINETIV